MTEHLYLSKPGIVHEKPKAKLRHQGLLQDQLRRAQRAPWTPTFSLAVRLLLLIRISGAMYSNISDCDEVFNFWEPLHLLDQGYGFQTWELSPKYALRSWAYILLHLMPSRIGKIFVAGDKRPSFFAVRIFLGTLSTLVEAAFYRTIVEKVNERVGRYYFFFMFFSAGMWNASTALLPSSLAMYTTTLACAYAFETCSSGNQHRTLVSTLLFAVGGIVGWPFALALAIPFIFEELFVSGADIVMPHARISWMVGRFRRLILAGLTSALILIPVICIDSLAYGKLVIIPWHIIKYNIFGGSERGPDLYGTEPWYFYLNNLILNFNMAVPLALMSFPGLVLTYVVDRRRLGFTSTPNQSSHFTLLALRLAPFYIWLGILTMQPHKEERFMYPVYPLLCFNAAVATYLIRGWMEVAYIKVTRSPYQASQTTIFGNFTFSVVVATSLISISRIFALWHYYHAPMMVSLDFQMTELSRLLNDTGFLPVYPPTTREEAKLPIDFSPLKEFGLTVCLGKEWHRFTGHYLIPNGIRVDFVKSDFDGMLPRHFEEIDIEPNQGNDFLLSLSRRWWLKPQTTFIPKDLNDLNKEDLSHYVPISSCDYLIDLDFPLRPVSSLLEPRYATMESTWERVTCYPFLDARHSFVLTRAFWLPSKAWQSRNEFGDYCLLKNKKTVGEKEVQTRKRMGT